jgi:amidase
LLSVWTIRAGAISCATSRVLDAVAGPRTGGAASLAPPRRPYAEVVAAAPPRLRAGLMPRDVMTGMSIDPECVAAVEATGALLQSLGHEVEESHPAALDGLFLRTAKAIATIGAVARQAQVRWLSEIAGRELTADDVDAEALAAARGGGVTEAQLADALAALTRGVSPIHWWTQGNDLLVTPVLRQPPWPLGLTGGAADAGVFQARSASAASRRCRCRCTGRRAACRLACSSLPRAGGRTYSCASPRSPKRRARGPTGGRRSVRGNRDYTDFTDGGGEPQITHGAD